MCGYKNLQDMLMRVILSSPLTEFFIPSWWTHINSTA